MKYCKPPALSKEAAEQRNRLNADVSEDDADHKALIASCEVLVFCDHCLSPEWRRLTARTACIVSGL